MALPHGGGGGAAAVVTAVLVLAYWSQVRHWRNSVTLSEHALAVTEEKWLAHSNMGAALTELGKLDDPTFHIREAIRIAPQNSGPHYNLGVALAK